MYACMCTGYWYADLCCISVRCIIAYMHAPQANLMLNLPYTSKSSIAMHACIMHIYTLYRIYSHICTIAQCTYIILKVKDRPAGDKKTGFTAISLHTTRLFNIYVIRVHWLCTAA